VLYNIFIQTVSIYSATRINYGYLSIRLNSVNM